jgi:hypothetical protein
MIILGLVMVDVIAGHAQYTLYVFESTRCVYVPIDPSWDIRLSFNLYDSLRDLVALGDASFIFGCIFFIFGLYESFARCREEKRETLRDARPEDDEAK